MTAQIDLTYAELCAGYGGLGMGVQAVLGGHMLWCSEFDADPSRILAHHWRDVPNHGDLTAIDWHAVPRVDVITAGFPCQPFSHAGKRLGANDERHLWPYIAQGIAIMRPQLVVLENVRGLLSGQGEPDTDEILALEARIDQLAGALARARHRRKAARDDTTRARFNDLAHRLMVKHRAAMARAKRARRELVRAIGAVVGSLADIGYDAQWYGLRAADVGAPHGRFRVFIFAWPAGAIDDPEWIVYRAQRVAPVRGDLTDLALLPTPAVNDMGAAYTPDTWDEWTARMKAAHGNGNGHGKSLEIEAQRLLRTPTAQLAINGGSQHPDKRKAGGHGPTLADEIEHLLPTPATANSKSTRAMTSSSDNGRRSGGGQSSPPGLDEVASILSGAWPDHMPPADRLPPKTRHLLPTPTAQDSEASGGVARKDVTLTDATVRAKVAWGEYEPAVRRWESLTRPAPSPTEPGPKGGPRLSPRFVEWMMGLPLGHVTDPAIWAGMTDSAARNAELKALGNGVVPQQAAAATVTFVADMWAERMAKAATA